MKDSPASSGVPLCDPRSPKRVLQIVPGRAAVNMNQPTRWSLIRRLADPGDAVAWEDFYATYGRAVHGMALKAGLSQQEAEDAVQETVASMVKSLPEFKADQAAGSFKSWLFQLARWRIANQFEKRPKLDRGEVRGGRVAERDSGTGTAERVVDPSLNLLELAWDVEWEEAVLDLALRRLKAKVKARHFQMFYLHVIKQQSARVVASALGTSSAQVHLMKYRLLPRFKRIVREIAESPL